MVRGQKLTRDRSATSQVKVIIISCKDDIEKISPYFGEKFYLKNPKTSVYYQGINFIEALSKLVSKEYKIGYDRWIFDCSDQILAFEEAVRLGFKNICISLSDYMLTLCEQKSKELSINLFNDSDLKTYDLQNFTKHTFEDFLKNK